MNICADREISVLNAYYYIALACFSSGLGNSSGLKLFFIQIVLPKKFKQTQKTHVPNPIFTM